MDVLWVAGGEPLVAGPQARAMSVPLSPPFTIVGARFLPGAGPWLLGVAAEQLRDQHHRLDQLETAPARRLLEQLARVEDPAHAAAALASVIGALVDEAGAPDPVVRRAAVALGNPGARVRELARELAISERQLQRRFQAAVGYGPKTLQRVLRLQRLIRGMRAGPAGPPDLSRLALGAGYADQAHMTREAGELAGMTPGQLARVVRA